MRLIKAAAFASILWIASNLGGAPASAVTADLAKKCSLLLAKAFPPREPGNPAAGSAAGTVETQRRYFAKCISNGGQTEEDDGTDNAKPK